MKYTEALQMRKRAGWLSYPGWHAGIAAGHGLAKLFGGKEKEGDIYKQQAMDEINHGISPED